MHPSCKRAVRHARVSMRTRGFSRRHVADKAFELTVAVRHAEHPRLFTIAATLQLQIRTARVTNAVSRGCSPANECLYIRFESKHFIPEPRCNCSICRGKRSQCVLAPRRPNLPNRPATKRQWKCACMHRTHALPTCSRFGRMSNTSSLAVVRSLARLLDPSSIFESTAQDPDQAACQRRALKR